ncbi:MAG: nucleotidyltransferase substrate binding protein [Candidatus Dependentiae bacterium]|nr:nucleotidyltransferase substrate binding protein [Candidatus Dependentiae bacterium]
MAQLKLTKKLETLRAALETLQESVSDKKESEHYDEKRYAQYRDSLIQRFEYCTDLLWKILKSYLQVKYGSVPVPAPKPVFKEAYSLGILSDCETELFLEMIDARNTTSHIYKEEFAEALSRSIPNFYRAMATLLQRLEAPASRRSDHQA